MLYNHHLCSQIDSRWFICYRDAKSIRLSYVEQPSGLATILITAGRRVCFYIGQCHDATIIQESADCLKRSRKVESSTRSLYFIVGFLVLWWRFLQVRRHCWLSFVAWLPCDCHLFYNDNLLEKFSSLAVGSFISFWSFRLCLSPPWAFMFLGLLAWSLLLQRLNSNWLYWLFYYLCMHNSVASIKIFLSETHHWIEQERKLGAIFDTAIANHQKYFVQWSAEQLSILTAFGEFLVGCIADILPIHFPSGFLCFDSTKSSHYAKYIKLWISLHISRLPAITIAHALSNDMIEHIRKRG